MNKQAFLEQLRKGLSGLPKKDIDERLTFYCEMIDDRMEDGIPEEAEFVKSATLRKLYHKLSRTSRSERLLKKR